MAEPTPERSSSRPWRATKWVLGIGLTALAAAAPAVAEAEAEAALETRGALGQALGVDIDLGGVELANLGRSLPGGRALAIDRVHVRPSFAGLHVELEGLRALPARSEGEPPSPPPASPSPASTSPSQADAPPDPLVSALRRARGIPIHVVHHGALELELEPGVWLRADQLEVELPGDGSIHASGSFALGPSEGAPAWLDAEFDADARDEQPRELAVRGRLVGARGGPALYMAGHASPRSLDLELDDGEDGRAALIVSRGSGPERATRLELDAEDLPLAALEPMLDSLLSRFDALTGEHGSKLGLDGATLSGRVELAREPERDVARFDAVELGGVELAASLLANERVSLSPLTIDGELGRLRASDEAPAGPRRYVSAILGHRGVQAELSGQLDERGLSFDLQIPEGPCQDLLEATPGLSPVLAGTELSGQLGAHFGLDLDFAALERARARYLGDDPLAFDLDHFEPPGELRFELPYLEQCVVERLGPGVDIEGLAGPYRHDFIDAEGHASRRVLAVGDPGYVSIYRVPRLAQAFVILEDALFRRHDGFDRAQIERAFWFNLLEGRVRRGASTITQQTARTLWLGVDRSLSRKLAEAMLAAELERGLSKQRILEVYLNLVELGPNIHGVTEAARFHFGKEPEQLSLIQALHLASLAPAPVTYSRRFADGTIDEAWREHLRHQVHRLQIRHLITAEVAREAMRLDLELEPR